MKKSLIVKFLSRAVQKKDFFPLMECEIFRKYCLSFIKEEIEIYYKRYHQNLDTQIN